MNHYLKKGVKFECQGSSNCCVSRNSYGYVYLSKFDLKRLLFFLANLSTSNQLKFIFG